MEQLYQYEKSSTKNNLIRYASYIVNTAIILVVLVVLMGGWTRINDAGLSCPDWPGCFGQLSVPSTLTEIEAAKNLYPLIALEQGKSWLEMIHRYLAGSLGLLILGLALISLWVRKEQRYPRVLSFGLLLLVVFQALLGMWTVTMKLLPIVVTAHLFGGLLTTVLLLLFKYQLAANKGLFKYWQEINFFFLFGLILLFLQIILGGWTSSNYAGWGCSDWLGCNPSLDIKYDFAAVFHVTLDTHYSHQGGNLSLPQRGAIQITHRLGALLVFLYFLVALFRSHKLRSLWPLSLVAFVLVCAQIVLGFLNIVWSLPTGLALGHHFLALTLLIVSTLVLVKSIELNQETLNVQNEGVAYD